MLVSSRSGPKRSGNQPSVCIEPHIGAQAVIVVQVIRDSPSAETLKNDVVSQAAHPPISGDRESVAGLVGPEVRYSCVRNEAANGPEDSGGVQVPVVVFIAETRQSRAT